VIADYEMRPVDEIISALDRLQPDDLRRVKEREEQGQGRRRVIVAVHRRLGLPPPPVKVKREGEASR
jgi:hypothetical protein